MTKLWRHSLHVLILSLLLFLWGCDTIPKHLEQGTCVKNYWQKDVYEIVKVDGMKMTLRNTRTNEKKVESRLDSPLGNVWPQVPCPVK